jgi:hypothetical protein
MHAILIAILLLASVQSEHAVGGARRRAVKHPSLGVALPNAAADSYSLGEGSVLTIAAPGVLANDTLNGATIASFGPATGAEQTALGVAVQTAHGGSLSLSGGGGFTYTPANAFSGTDTFRYVIRNAGGSSSATVTIVVSALQASAVNDSYTTEPESPLSVPAPGVLTNDTVGGGRIASFGKTGTEQTSLGAISSTAQGGTIVLNADGSFSYTPPPTVDDGYGYTRPYLGVDTFVYAIQRDSVVSTATVNVAVEVPGVGADYVVTSPGHFYSISGLTGENPVLQLTRGRTYKFQISVSPIHPFAILDAPPGSVTNNNITSGTVTFTVPMTAQNYRYRCSTHAFGNVINTVP